MGDILVRDGLILEEFGGTEAERETSKIIRQVQPTVVSEDRRRDVVDYVQTILKGFLGCEVFPFGSVPLKTYLPDGDIDLTAFCGFNFEEAFANDVYNVLVAEDRNPAAKFVVKDVQYIRAEVKLVKCLVQNIVVDISFNQIGGLCALGFLEEIDRLIGKDHLFKRSIILIKAWCYYESRILGAHHGLISTYALETLVLYIFHLFHSSLDGPLAVLHKFLDYFSKFDWENLCVSLNGPLLLASLPESLTDKPETSGEDLLLSDDFMRECVRKFSVPSRGAETTYKTFTQKHLNIVDPLKENNNLGRSVSKGNFFRIRSAFSYGARKLGQILSPSQENVAKEVRKFFANTLDRHGNGLRPDVQDYLQLSSCNGFDSEVCPPFSEPFRDQGNTHEEDYVIVSNFREARATIDETNSEHKNGFNELAEDRNELETSSIPDLRITEVGDDVGLSVLEDKHLPYVSHPLENGHMENGHLDVDEDQHTDSSPMVGGRTHLESNGFVSWEQDNGSWQDTHSDYQGTHCSGGNGRHEFVNLLPDLSGDFDCHIDNLQYGRWLYDQGLAMPIHPVQMVPPHMFHHNLPWDARHSTVPVRHDVVNGTIARPPFFPTNSQAPHFGDEMSKHRGLGTYFPPVTSPLSYRDRSSIKGRSQGQLKSPRTNGRGPIFLDRNFLPNGLIHQGIERPKFPDHPESSPRGKGYKETNGFVHGREQVFEYDPPENPSPAAETCRASDTLPSPGSHSFEAVRVDDNRPSLKSYRLKDDEDFPPLCA